jgi:hypothetical protein
MTPKEKAKELYCKYTEALNIRDLQITANPFAKQCALIAVDEILNALSYKISSNFEELKYFEEVKQEIEKL